jgi:hypothetical protein
LRSGGVSGGLPEFAAQVDIVHILLNVVVILSLLFFDSLSIFRPYVPTLT